MLVMRIRQQMIYVNSKVLIYLVILLSASVSVSSEDRHGPEEVFLSQLVNKATGAINEKTAELPRTNCRFDLTCFEEANEGLSSFSEETSRTKDWLLAKEKIQKLTKFLHLQSKQTLLDWIRKQNLLFHVYGEKGGSASEDRECPDSLFATKVVRRRKLLQSTPPAPEPTAGSTFPTPSPSPSPDLAPSPSVNPPSPTPGTKPFFPPVDRSPPPPGENGSSDPVSGSDVEPVSATKSNHQPIIIAVAVTASVTFVFAALLFFCCTRMCGGGRGARRNDERPLLSLSLSDYSAGSSHKSFGMLNSINEAKLGQQYPTNNSMHDKRGSFVDGKRYAVDGQQNETVSFGAASGDVKPSSETIDASNKIGLVPPPPGRIGSTSSLKPPPGRAVPLPPEPPASLRPPPISAGPPPPPPPTPPLPRKAGSAAPSPPGPPPPPPMGSGGKAGSRPPPPPKGGIAPPRPPPAMPTSSKVPRPPVASNSVSNNIGAGMEDNSDAPKAKLKPFFWDKVVANPDHSMVWHQIKSGSFQFNEEMIETLFGHASSDKNKNGHKKDSSSHDHTPQYVQILDHKKAQNLSILLRALNVTIEEVCDALHEGNELPAELLQTLLKMAPTPDEELKLRLFTGELSELGPAERFLKALVDIPFAFKRLEALLFMCTLEEEVNATKDSFETLEVACKELKSSRLFLKLLEAVLKTGNRMNDGTFRGGAQAFKLDTLLKLSDVKGIDGKTTLLHFVVQEIIRSEGVRAARAAKESRSFSNISVKTDDLLEDVASDTIEHYRNLGLQVVSRLSSELENVKKAAVLDAETLTGTVSKLGQSLLRTRDFLNKDMKNLEEDSGFHEILKSFVQNAEASVMGLLEEEKRIMALVKSTGDYFHGKAGKDEGLRLFVIVRDFLIILDKVCKEVREAQQRMQKTLKKESSTASSSSEPRHQPSPDLRPRLFPAIQERRMDESSSSSDDDG
ncbi:hypothetical protein K2173_003145 [Erythroxylum novogranatense]|uniref:Formin-like protein n=1 Tax=Erythroxylum novogranatense TaxID=1862640 RepID=A0AAV8TBV5_9ROSI|nr:hypothetical protein K2173_003145 [Erythroxylum novogranatense]